MKKTYHAILCGLILSITQINAAPILVSLGHECEQAVRFREFGLRFFALPFDWLRSYSFEGVCLALEEKCAHFLDTAYLEYKHGFGFGVIKNTRYNIEFVHDFPTVLYDKISEENENEGSVVANYLDYLPGVNDKYQRRIDRLFAILQGNDSVIFFRTHTTPHYALLFTDLMRRHYPQLNYLLVVVHNNPTLEYDWNIPHVRNFRVQTKDRSNNNNWYHQSEWQKIFEQLGIACKNKQQKIP